MVVTHSNLLLAVHVMVCYCRCWLTERKKKNRELSECVYMKRGTRLW